MKSPKPPKTFVLDTNVLLHDPHSIFKFEDNHIALPVEVLEELDRFKGDPSERGRNARFIHRELKNLFAGTKASMTDGAALPGGGRLSVVVNPYLNNGEVKSRALKKLKTVFPDLTKVDNRILACLVYVTDKAEGPAILVSKDINMILKAGSLGLRAEDFLNDKVSEKVGEESSFYPEVRVTIHQLQRFSSSGELELSAKEIGSLGLNDYLFLVSDEDRRVPARHFGNGLLRRLALPPQLHFPGGVPIRPRNLEQQFLVDALVDPEIQLVTCYGKAGTGKTIVTTAGALHLIAEGRYDGASITRPVISLGKEIGFLPGDIQAKMTPWLQPYHDALNVIFPPNPEAQRNGTDGRRTAKKKKTAAQPMNGTPAKPYVKLIEAGLLEIEALSFIRGRSIPRRFFILDETQQLTPHEVKTVVSRMSEGSKLILLGDPSQIDNPYVDSQSNGLVYARNRLRDTPISAHVKLTKGERSALAELAVTRM